MRSRWTMIGGAVALGVAGCLLSAESAGLDGGYTLAPWLVTTAGLGALVAALGWRTPWARTLGLAGLLVIGMAAQLALLKPQWLHYVRLTPAQLAAAPAALAILGLLLQAVVVFGLGRRRLRELATLARTAFPGRRLVLAALVLVIAAAQLTLVWARRSDPLQLGFYAAQIVVVSGFFLLNAVTLWLCVTAAPAAGLRGAHRALGRRLTLPGPLGEPAAWDRRLPLTAALFVFAVAVFMAYVVLGRVPHIQDEVAYLFQAQCYAQGMLSAPLPPEPEAFDFYLLTVDDGRWYGAMTPGWPFILTVGMWLGIPYLLNPLLAAITVLLTHALVSRLAGRGTANVVTVLLAASPWFLLISGSLMGHTSSLCLGVGACYFLVRSAQDRAPWPALVGGLLLGMQFVVRPMDALVVGAFAGVWFAVMPQLRLRPASLLATVIGGLASSLWVFAYNHHMVGEATTFVIKDYFNTLWYPGADRLGFAPDIGNPTPVRWEALDPEPGHGFVDVALNTNQNVVNVNFELFGWAVGSLLLPLVHVLRASRWSRMDRSAVAFIVVLAAAYSTYWFSGGPDYGARYWYLAIVPLLWLSARGLVTLVALLEARQPDGLWPQRVGLGVGLLVFGAIAVFVPWRMVGKYPNYRRCNADVRELHEAGTFGRALVLIRVEDPVEIGPALALNAPALDGDGPVYARDLGPASRERLRAAFPDRPLYLVEGRSVTGGRTRVVAGPIPPGE